MPHTWPPSLQLKTPIPHSSQHKLPTRSHAVLFSSVRAPIPHRYCRDLRFSHTLPPTVRRSMWRRYTLPVDTQMPAVIQPHLSIADAHVRPAPKPATATCRCGDGYVGSAPRVYVGSAPRMCMYATCGVEAVPHILYHTFGTAESGGIEPVAICDNGKCCRHQSIYFTLTVYDPHAICSVLMSVTVTQ